jgi:hypothetical protein
MSTRLASAASARPVPPHDEDFRPDPDRWMALGVILGAGFMTLLDASIVNVALPSIVTRSTTRLPSAHTCSRSRHVASCGCDVLERPSPNEARDRGIHGGDAGARHADLDTTLLKEG